MSIEHPNYGCYSGIGSRNWWKQVFDRTIKSTTGYELQIDIDVLYDDFTKPSYWLIYDDVIEFLKDIKAKGLIIGASKI